MEPNMDSIQKKLIEYARALNGDVSLNNLFSDAFVQGCSKYSNIKELLTPAGITSQETFDAWCESDSADRYIRTHTDFSSWKEMRSAAAKQYAQKKQRQIREGIWKDETFDTGVLFDDIHIFLNFHVA